MTEEPKEAIDTDSLVPPRGQLHAWRRRQRRRRKGGGEEEDYTH